MKKTLAAVLSCIAVIVTLTAFLFSCIVIPTDAQGVFIFIFTLPVMLISIAVGYYVAKANHLHILRIINFGTLVLIGFFFVSAFVPPLSFFSSGIINLSTSVFTKVMGESPKIYFAHGTDMYQMIQDELVRTQKQKLDFTIIKGKREWNTLCVFEAKADQAAVNQLVGQEFNLKLYNPYKEDVSDRYVFIFKQDKSVSYYTWFKPSEIDLSKFSGRCMPRSEARFKRQASDLSVFDRDF